MKDRFPVQFCFYRKNPLIQPCLQRHIIRIGTKQCHAGMGMGIFKARHQQISLTVYLSVPYDALKLQFPIDGIRIRAVPHIKNPFVSDPDFTFDQFFVLHRQYPCIIKSNIHSSCNILSCHLCRRNHLTSLQTLISQTGSKARTRPAAIPAVFLPGILSLISL